MKILRIHFRNSALIMTNGIRKVRQGVDIFEKEFLILVSSSQTVLQNMASSTTTFSLQSINCMVHSLSGFYMFPKEGEEKHRETPPSQHYYVLFFQVGCTAMFYSAQGSVQPQETGESCIGT